MSARGEGQLWFRREPDGIFRASDTWPEWVLIAAEFIMDADPLVMRLTEDGRSVKFTPGNGWAIYRLEEYDAPRHEYYARLTESGGEA